MLKKPKPGGTLKPLSVVSPIHKAGRQMSLYLSKSLKGLEVAPGHAHLLTYLMVYGPCAVRELLQVFGYKPTTLTNVLNLLSDRGFVSRELNHKDRRSLLVKCTVKGARLAHKARKFVEEFDLQMNEQVSAADMRGFDRVMKAVAKVTEVNIGKTREGN